MKEEELQIKKIEILIHAWGDFSKQIEAVSNHENRISLSFFTFCGVILIYLKSLNSEPSMYANISLTIIISIVTLFVVILLYNNNRRLKWLCKSLVSIQKSLGVYRNGFYDVFESNNGDKKTLFNPIGMEWGENGKYLNLKYYLLLVIASGITTIVIIWTVK